VQTTHVSLCLISANVSLVQTTHASLLISANASIVLMSH
jgi:hypothetical protein